MLVRANFGIYYDDVAVVEAEELRFCIRLAKETSLSLLVGEIDSLYVIHIELLLSVRKCIFIKEKIVILHFKSY